MDFVCLMKHCIVIPVWCSKLKFWNEREALCIIILYSICVDPEKVFIKFIAVLCKQWTNTHQTLYCSSLVLLLYYPQDTIADIFFFQILHTALKLNLAESMKTFLSNKM